MSLDPLTFGEAHSVTVADPRKQGAIRISKTRKNAAQGSGDFAQSGVIFTITDNNNSANTWTVTTDANGIACQGGLLLGSYTVKETVPTGYRNDKIDGATPTTVGQKSISVSSEGNCTSGYTSIAFHNMPLSDITISFSPEVTGATALTSISCTGLTASSSNTTSATFTGLVPGTYNCQVVIDP